MRATWPSTASNSMASRISAPDSMRLCVGSSLSINSFADSGRSLTDILMLADGRAASETGRSMRERTTIAKNPQIKLPSVNSVGNTATARIGFIGHSLAVSRRLLPAGNDMTAGANRVAGLHGDFYGIGWQDKLGSRAQFNHTKNFASCDCLPGLEGADDSPGQHSRDLS